jgi:hypothetical protein
MIIATAAVTGQVANGVKADSRSVTVISNPLKLQQNNKLHFH